MNHAQEALSLVRRSSHTSGNGSQILASLDAQHAQVRATLALVEQQRIANLISYFTQIDDTTTALPVLHEIREALGLGATQ